MSDYPHLTPYKRPRDYMGATYPDTYEVIGVHRDSGSVERSNFAVLERDYGDADGVFVTRASHWAVGWVDTLRVDPAEASPETLAALNDAVRRIEEVYLVLDEEHLSEMEWTEATEYWANESVEGRMHLCQRAGVSVFAARHDYLPEDPNGALWDLVRPE